MRYCIDDNSKGSLFCITLCITLYFIWYFYVCKKIWWILQLSQVGYEVCPDIGRANKLLLNGKLIFEKLFDKQPRRGADSLISSAKSVSPNCSHQAQSDLSQAVSNFLPNPNLQNRAEQADSQQDQWRLIMLGKCSQQQSLAGMNQSFIHINLDISIQGWI